MSCNNLNKIERKLNQDIILASNDKIVTESEFNNLKTFLLQYKSMIKTVSNTSDTALCALIVKISGRNVVIKCPSPPEAPCNLNKIRFYIETSQSMGGYMNGGTEFQDVVNNLIGILGGEYNFIHFLPNTITSQIGRYKNVTDYTHDLTTSGFKFGGHSPLDQMFGIILDSTRKNDVNFLVTDAIMSGPNNAISANPQFNIQQKFLMMNLIRAKFEAVKDSFGVSIYGFRSKFNSSAAKGFFYFTYDNTHITQNFQLRPFYIFIFGKKQCVIDIDNRLRKNTFFKPEKELHFGLQTRPETRYVTLHSHMPPQLRGSALLMDDNSIRCNWNPSAARPVKFAVGLNLSELPGYSKTAQYFTNHLRIRSSNNLKIDSTNLKISQLNLGMFDPVVEVKKINSLGANFYLDLPITDLYTQQEEINIKLLKEEDRWYEEWSCDDDSNIQTNPTLQTKTFNFKTMIYGIREAYKSDSDNSFVDINIPVKNH